RPRATEAVPPTPEFCLLPSEFRPSVRVWNMIWRLRDRSIDLARSGLIMGVLNVTPDSFSDSFISEEAAFRHAQQMISDGAAILDVGGESSRPGSDPVTLDE